MGLHSHGRRRCPGYLFPWLADAIGSFTVGTTNIPIAIGLILMMYSPLAKVRYGEMPKVFKSKRLIVLSLVLNWVLCPLLMLVLAVVFLRDAPDYMAGIIMIGLARCIAMVLVWNDFTGGSNEYAAGLVAVNAVFQIAFYGPMAWLFLSVLAPMLGAPGMSIEVSAWQIAQSVLIYLGIPLVAGALTRFIGVRRFGEEGYSARVLPKTSKITPVALLFTIVIMFSMKGEMISSLPLDVLRIAVPLVVYFVVTFFASAWPARRAGADYERMASVAFTATGNNFELTIAVAAATFGLASGQAFAAVVGPLIEVPALILLVNAALRLKKRWYES
ncbi:MAG: ACR3 family arsenite efflux transporter [Collinsella sp.]|nr:ACR3 family arsenite efflux transporter [Collinsella sp.]MDY5551477.1 ACR3 family arsenite efflux transporter [Collinsella sp.]